MDMIFGCPGMNGLWGRRNSHMMSHEGTSPYRWDLGQNMVKTWPKPENSKIILRFAFLD